MTNKTPNPQDTTPSDTQKTSSGCGAMMAEMMKKHGGKNEQAPSGETDQQAQDSTGKESGCGCGAMMERMMGKFFKSRTGPTGEQH